MSYLLRALRGVLLVSFLVVGCDAPASVTLLPVSRQRVQVSSPLRVTLVVNNPRGLPLAYRFEAPASLVAIESVATITGSPSGGEFRFTPLASHVGTHEITFVISSLEGQEYDRQSALIEVTPAADAAPVFLEPGAGGTFDLERDPCVRFHVEIRDDDSPDVAIRPSAGLPDGASLSATGPKSADFEWCPTRDQIGTSERWTIQIEADDLDHAPVPHDFVAVLRTGGSTGCPGLPPEIALMMPLAGERVTSGSGYEVSIAASDDLGLRDAPLLYWSTARPADPASPDITSFEQVSFEPDGPLFRARIPSLGLATGEEREVFFTVSATDNDDVSGTTCDHRTDLLPVVSFYAVGGADGGGLARCALCTGSVECASGLCVPAAGGARCLDACDAAESCASGLTCDLLTTTEGSLEIGCGTVTGVCSGGASCTDDAFEENDSVPASRALSFSGTTATVMAQICSHDDDYYRVTPVATDRVSFVVSGFSSSLGDLDLQVLDARGTIVGSSAGVTDMESVTYCARDATALYTRVFGYAGAQNPYSLVVTRAAGACCVDDSFEPDDSRAAARTLSGTDFDGTLCPDDDDWIAVPITSGSRIVVDLLFDGARADVDLELVGPTGTVLASSLGVTDSEHIDFTVSTAGTYALHVFSLEAASNDYLGSVMVTRTSGCTATIQCPVGQVCSAGACRSGGCTSLSMCPAMHRCPDAGPGTGPSTCGAWCSTNGDCRSAETCKWFPEGRACEVHGAGANGATCATFADCGGQRACLDWPGGYCARAACTSDADCESGTFCAGVSGLNVCALDCATDATRCHAGLACRTITGVGGASRRVCAP